MSTDEMHNYEDQDPHSPLTSTAKLGPYASFLQNLSDMTQEMFNKAFKALPLPTPGPLPWDILLLAAIEASHTNRHTESITDIISDVAYDIVLYIWYTDIVSDIVMVLLEGTNTMIQMMMTTISTVNGRWAQMKCAIMRTKILRVLWLLLPSLDPMPAFFKTYLIIMIWSKRRLARLSKRFRRQRISGLFHFT